MTLLDAFSDLTEVRADNHRYPLSHLVFIAVCMITCGADDWKMVSYLGKKKLSWLKLYIPLPHGVLLIKRLSEYLNALIQMSFVNAL